MTEPRHDAPGSDGEDLIVAPAGTPWHRSPKVAIGLMVVFTALSVFIGARGPSVMTLTLGPRDGSLLPPYYLPAGLPRPNDWVIAILGWGLVIIGALATWVSWRAVAAGWRPDNRKLFGLGAAMNILIALVPPMTSADVLMYAAYGRLSALGIDPYTVTPAEVLRGQWDPVLRWMEDPWQDTVNVYGPMLTLVMWLANVLGRENVHDIVMWFQLVFTGALLAAGAATAWLARHDSALQTRAILMTVACPVMIWGVTAGAHNESLGLAFAIAGFMFLRSNPLVAGLLIGTGMTSKATVGIYGLAMAWAYRRELKKFILAGIGGAIPNIIAYVLIYPDALKTASKNASYVASTSWAFPIRRFLEPFLDGDMIQSMMSASAWGMTLVLGWMLSRVLPWRAVPGLAPGKNPEHDPLTIAVRSSVVISGAWLATSAYTLPWYDLMCFMPMALLGATRLDLIELFRVTALNLGYVLGRIIPMSPSLGAVAFRGREIFSSTVAIGIVVAIVLWWHEHGIKVGSHRKAPRAGDETDEPARAVS
ncbi:polyprenol phosphomannose-dependent alpha 1,6 mannosyltransferase MptB [Mariniluteicoccus flavus]